MTTPTPGGKPARRERTRPLELIGISLGLGIFVGLVVLMGSRELVVALEFAGVGFIVSLVVLAMLLLAVGPKDTPPGAPRGDDEPPAGH